MKIKLFTHTDLDGIGCAILGQLVFGKENMNIEYCNYDDVNEKVNDFYTGLEKNKYDVVYITDISVNNDVAKIIEYYKDDKTYPKIQLIDHHPTALFLNKYDWCKVQIEDKLIWNDLDENKKDEIHKMSGTYLFYLWLEDNLDITDWKGIEILGDVLNLNYLVEMTRQYDTWEWNTIYKNNAPKQFNNLLYILGRDKFIDNIIEKVHSRVEFTFTDLLLLDLEQDKIKNYINRKSKEMTRDVLVVNNKTYSMGIVFAEQYISELGNTLATDNSYLDFIAIISGCKTVSFRSIKDDINLGEIAKTYGGGGHPKAAGMEVSAEVRDNIIDLIFKIEG